MEVMVRLVVVVSSSVNVGLSVVGMVWGVGVDFMG